jgi:hypothetical protein
MGIALILLPSGIFYGHLVYFVAFLVHFSPFWYVVPTKKNLATLIRPFPFRDGNFSEEIVGGN